MHIFLHFSLLLMSLVYVTKDSTELTIRQKKNESNLTVPEIQGFHHVLLHEVEARQPSTVLFAPPTSLPRVVCVMNQIHWG